MEIKVLDKPIAINEARIFAEQWYTSLLKGCVDISDEKVALGGDYHIESCELLVRQGSRHENIWGFNIRFDEDTPILEFDSMVNLKPAFGNRSRVIQDEEVIKKAEAIIRRWILF